jgi:hypothetical protein
VKFEVLTAIIKMAVPWAVASAVWQKSTEVSEVLAARKQSPSGYNDLQFTSITS